MIPFRRGGKIVRARRISCARDAAFAVLLALAPLASSAAPASRATSGDSSVSSTLRSLAHPTEFAASTTAAAHRILLPDGPAPELTLSTLEGVIELRTRTGFLHARLPLVSTPCHLIDPASDEVRLQCKTGRIDAAVVAVNGHHYLDLRELRGLPTNEAEDGPPRVDYPPDLFNLGAACPSDTNAGRGECAFESGQNAKAEIELSHALKQEPTTRTFAALRLGDLAVRRHDPNTALFSYLQAGDQGYWGRLANERICELTGSCFDDTLMASFDAIGMPDALRYELAIRKIRMLLLLGRWSEGMEQLATLLDAQPGSCQGYTKVLCRRMALAALRTPACPREAALSSYLRLPAFMSGPLAADLARAAAEDAGELGAPAYGAALLSATARLSARADLLAHAQEALDLYRSANDPFRAHVMWSWASTRLTAKELRALPPDTLGAPAENQPASAASTAGADLEAEQAASALAIARSTLARSRISAPGLPPARKRR